MTVHLWGGAFIAVTVQGSLDGSGEEFMYHATAPAVAHASGVLATDTTAASMAGVVGRQARQVHAAGEVKHGDHALSSLLQSIVVL
jgi:hypothetical protein